MKLLPLVSVGAIHCLALVGCDLRNPNGMVTAQANGVSEIPEVKQFSTLFPGADHFITHYSGNKGPSYWNSKTGLHGRYILTLTFPIEFDGTRTHPRRTGSAAFFLNEVSEVEMRADGTVAGIGYTTKQLEFGIEEWERVVKSGGDWSVLGFQVTKDKPIEHFEKAWKGG